MAANDPLESQAATEVAHQTAAVQISTGMIASMSQVTARAAENFSATMDALNKQMLANLDFANKIQSQRLELDPVQAAASAAVLQQAVKASQTTPPETGTKL